MTEVLKCGWVQECKVFEEVLTLQCPTFRLRVKLRGEGISPAIKVMGCYPDL